jgi:predicted TIM-barrel fold metal-dependent hydrolase
MKEARVVGALSMTADFMKDYPDLSSSGIKYCAGLREKIDYKRLEEKLKNKEYACIKIYLGYVHRWAYDAAYQPAYKLAEKYGVPVVFHTGDTYSTVAKLKFSDPLTIDEVAVTYPNVKFVIAHMGNPWIQSAAEVAYKNPNVYVEGSAFFAGPMSEYPAEKVATQMVAPIKWVFDYIENPKKVLFGTDWPLVPTKDYVGAFKKAIPEKYWDLVFYQNAIDVYQPEKSKILDLKLTGVQTDTKLIGKKTKETKKSQSPLKK